MGKLKIIQSVSGKGKQQQISAHFQKIERFNSKLLSSSKKNLSVSNKLLNFDNQIGLLMFYLLLSAYLIPVAATEKGSTLILPQPHGKEDMTLYCFKTEKLQAGFFLRHIPGNPQHPASYSGTESYAHYAKHFGCPPQPMTIDQMVECLRTISKYGVITPTGETQIFAQEADYEKECEPEIRKRMG